MMRKAPLLFLLLLCIAAVHAETGHITLLTVSDEAAGTGGTADLYLTIKPGQGSVYIDSFPLTRIDTQGSVRYANQIACDLLQTDCSRYDFFYTIRANSAIVGGPSAGAAITVLTVAMLDNQDIDQKVAMTGTINSGGIIGPVAGIDAKVRGAKAAGITTVLIPSLTTQPSNESNATAIDEQDINESAINDTQGDANSTLNETETQPAQQVKQLPLLEGKDEQLSDDEITVYRVSTVEEALQIFTGKNYSQHLQPLVEPAEYASRMHDIAEDICDRTAALELNVSKRRIPYNDTNNYTNRVQALDETHEYSRASLCFSKNIELSSALLQNASNATLNALYHDLRIRAKELDDQTRNQRIRTIGDLETYAIVKERIIEAQALLDRDDAKEPRGLAYAQERLVSAQSWSKFFGMQGKEVRLDTEYLRRACLAKLGEADERINYVRLYAPRIVGDAESMLEQAQSYSGNEPILCIFTASKAKAQANVLANAISVGQENVDALVQQKLDADTMILQKQQQKEFFPILGTSYTQYAADLRPTTPYSALIFSEYALELSNIDIYFPKTKTFRLPPGVSDAALLFGLGAVFGIALTAFAMGWRYNRLKKQLAKKPQRKTSRR